MPLTLLPSRDTAPTFMTRLLAVAVLILSVCMGTLTVSSATAPIAHADTLRDAIVSTAAGQVGTPGDGNECQPYGPCEDWCADFANWVWRNAGVSPVPPTHAARGEAKWGQDNGLFKARPAGQMGDPLPGDMVVFGPPADASGGHVAIVESVNSNGTITTINGNFNNAVKRWTFNPVTATSGSGNYPVSGYVAPPGAGSAPTPITVAGHRMVSAASADGRLELFASGGDQVYHTYQTAVNGSWAAWAPIGGPGNAHLAIAPAADGRLELFAINNDVAEHLYQTSVNGAWSNWETSFGGGGYDIAVGRNKSGRLEVVASNGGGVWHKYQSPETPGFWSGWSPMTDAAGNSGPGNSRLATASAGDGRIEVFAINDSVFQHVYQTATDGAWSNWETAFGGGGYDVAVGTNKSGRLEVVASNGGGVWHKYQSPETPGGWSGWSPMTDPAGNSGPGNARLATASAPDGRIEVFAINGTVAQHVYQTASDGGWSNWETGFGGGGTDVAAAANQNGTLDVFGSNPGGVYQKQQTPGGASPWSGWSIVQSGGPGI